MDQNFRYYHSSNAPALASQQFTDSLEHRFPHSRRLLPTEDGSNMFSSSTRQQNEFFGPSQWAQYEPSSSRIYASEQLSQRGQQASVSPFSTTVPYSPSQTSVFSSATFPMRVPNSPNQSYYAPMAGYNLIQPSFDLTQTPIISSPYSLPASPDSRVSVSGSPYLHSTVTGGTPEPESQVRVIESRPKPQCWDHGCNGREFSTFSNLLRHQRERSGASAKSECPQCGAVFTRTTARNTHIAQGKCKGGRESAN